ncbi:MAG: hypothetical protein JRI53_05910 [Deltaproteobacteria bacterium]|nr:hypothetical protein [Deltaproteobacteria bacterium]MBW1984236.1 hypothetical protein [Deltaproteobacteria bacterium]MBW2180109.1 hypothetical protein [Deltaproteobacteria bacterium]MBW2364083.1 hypothetical protein [Deltaproteobacteria bacterium]
MRNYIIGLLTGIAAGYLYYASSTHSWYVWVLFAIGSGVCAMTCPNETLKLHRTERQEKPFDTDMEWYMTVAQDNNRL